MDKNTQRRLCTEGDYFQELSQIFNDKVQKLHKISSNLPAVKNPTMTPDLSKTKNKIKEHINDLTDAYEHIEKSLTRLADIIAEDDLIKKWTE